MRWGRGLPGWLAGVVLPLAVCVGLFVMHGLDDPAHGTDIHTAQPTAGHASATGDEHAAATEDHHHCTDCPSALHVIVVCLAVLATAGLAASWSRLRPALATVITAAYDRGRILAVPISGRCARPVWVRLAVMLC